MRCAFYKDQIMRCAFYKKLEQLDIFIGKPNMNDEPVTSSLTTQARAHTILQVVQSIDG